MRRPGDTFRQGGGGALGWSLDHCVGTINKWITESIPALMGDPPYALLNAKRVCEMVIDVVVAAELLMESSLSDVKRELTASFVHLRMLAVEMIVRRIGSGDASRIK